MKRNKSYYLLFLIVFVAYMQGSGQIPDYKYTRAISGLKGEWNKIILPDDIYKNISKDFSDIRIFGITEKNDTLEIPYLLKHSGDEVIIQDVSFNVINQTKNSNGYFYTFENTTNSLINHIELEFNATNFDWKVKLEGSNDQISWFTIIEDYRIVSIKNNQTSFSFSKLVFPDSKFSFFRLSINSQENPQLAKAKVSLTKTSKATNKKYQIKSLTTKQDKTSKQTEITITLTNPVPINSVNVLTDNNTSYYRKLQVGSCADSIKYKNVWHKNYETVAMTYLNSTNKKPINCEAAITDNLLVSIDNEDNPPLNIKSIEILGSAYELIGRFPSAKSYYLTYGNNTVYAPNYDLKYFKDSVPTEINSVTLNKETLNTGTIPPSVEPLFKNKLWLWAIILLLVLVLGYFSLKMIKKVN